MIKFTLCYSTSKTAAKWGAALLLIWLRLNMKHHNCCMISLPKVRQKLELNNHSLKRETECWGFGGLILCEMNSAHDCVITLTYFLSYCLETLWLCKCYTCSQQSVNILDTVWHVDTYQKCSLECHHFNFICTLQMESVRTKLLWKHLSRWHVKFTWLLTWSQFCCVWCVCVCGPLIGMLLSEHTEMGT